MPRLLKFRFFLLTYLPAATKTLAFVSAFTFQMDEPMFTQPLMYQKIRNHPSVYKLYTDKLIAEGLVDQAEIDVSLKQQFLQSQKCLQSHFVQLSSPHKTVVEFAQFKICVCVLCHIYIHTHTASGSSMLLHMT